MPNKPSPTVSVIIPAYNAETTISECLASLSEQSYPTNSTEIIIINDASTDCTAQLLASYANQQGYTVITHEKNRALAAARNTGIRAAQGQILIFLDADLTVQPNFIAQHVRSHRQLADAIGVLGTTIYATGLPYDKYQRYLYEARRGARKSDAGQPLPYTAFLFNNSSVKSEVFNKIGLFDEKITAYGGEDTDMAYRIYCHYPDGFRYAPEIKAVHHHYRTFESVLRNVENFGREVVPYLIHKYPRLAELYGISFLKNTIPSIANSGNPLKYSIGSLLKSDPFRQILHFLYKICPYPLSNLIIRLSLASALLRGIASSGKEERRQL